VGAIPHQSRGREIAYCTYPSCSTRAIRGVVWRPTAAPGQYTDMARTQAQKRYNRCHPEKVSEWCRDYRRRHPRACAAGRRAQEAKIRYETLLHYSGGRAACSSCGIADERVLVVDHISGGGAAHRRSLGGGAGKGGAKFYRWLKQQGWPSGYRILCRNCDWVSRLTLLQQEVSIRDSHRN
jgi:hypothetical protein